PLLDTKKSTRGILPKALASPKRI
ncbi:unnamed protein product, partial [Rotaria socialis]